MKSRCRTGACLALVLAVMLGTPAVQAQTAADCRLVRGGFDIHPTAVCPSPVGICSQGDFSGLLRGPYTSIFQRVIPTAGNAATDVALFTAETTLQAEVGNWHGVLVLEEAGAFRSGGNGEFAEVYSVSGGTGDFATASGVLTATGVVDATVNGTAVYDGFICVQ